MPILHDFSRNPPSVMHYLKGSYVPAWPDWKEHDDGARVICSTSIQNRIYMLSSGYDVLRGKWNLRVHRHRPDLPHTKRSIPWELIHDQDFSLPETCASERAQWCEPSSETREKLADLRAIRLCHLIP